MRILVKEKGKRPFGIRLPTRLIFSKTWFRFFRRVSANKAQETPWSNEIKANEKGRASKNQKSDTLKFFKYVPEEKIDQAIEILRQMKKHHPGVPLVEVEASDGEYVLIQL